MMVKLRRYFAISKISAGRHFLIFLFQSGRTHIWIFSIKKKSLLSLIYEKKNEDLLYTLTPHDIHLPHLYPTANSSHP